MRFFRFRDNFKRPKYFPTKLFFISKVKHESVGYTHSYLEVSLRPSMLNIFLFYFSSFLQNCQRLRIVFCYLVHIFVCLFRASFTLIDFNENLKPRCYCASFILSNWRNISATVAQPNPDMFVTIRVKNDVVANHKLNFFYQNRSNFSLSNCMD